MHRVAITTFALKHIRVGRKNNRRPLMIDYSYSTQSAIRGTLLKKVKKIIEKMLEKHTSRPPNHVTRELGTRRM